MPVLLLPIAEIIGFIVIGGNIGLGLSLLWLAGATLLGFSLLKKSALPGRMEEVFLLENLFDNMCLVIAGLLLIFPGFVSDFIAVPFLLNPVRHWMFGHAKNNPDSAFRHFTQKGQNYASWYYKETRADGTTQTTIEGEYKKMDDDKNLPSG